MRYTRSLKSEEVAPREPARFGSASVVPETSKALSVAPGKYTVLIIAEIAKPG